MMTLSVHPPRCPSCAGFLPAEIPGTPRLLECPFCNAALGDEVFDDLDVRGRTAVALERAIREAEARRSDLDERLRAKRVVLAKQFQDELVRDRSLSDRETSAVVVVPWFDAPMVPLPDDRKQKFLGCITQFADDVIARQSSGVTYYDETSATIDNPNRLPDQVPAVACATCQGECCRNGREHAFFTRDLLRHRIREHGFVSVDEVVAAYEKHLPDESNEGSCIFHTDRGCNLPTSLRSLTCNTFVCSGLDDFLEHPPGVEVVEIAIVSQSNGERKRQTILRDDIAEG